VSHPFKSFPQGNGNIPLVGQAFAVKSGFSTVLIQCGCEAKTPLLVVGQAHSVCPACLRAFAVMEFAADNKTGQIHAKVGMARMDDEPAPVGVPS
jgi:hypothetical protein